MYDSWLLHHGIECGSPWSGLIRASTLLPHQKNKSEVGLLTGRTAGPKLSGPTARNFPTQRPVTSSTGNGSTEENRPPHNANATSDPREGKAKVVVIGHYARHGFLQITRLLKPCRQLVTGEGSNRSINICLLGSKIPVASVTGVPAF